MAPIIQTTATRHIVHSLFFQGLRRVPPEEPVVSPVQWGAGAMGVHQYSTLTGRPTYFLKKTKRKRLSTGYKVQVDVISRSVYEGSLWNYWRTTSRTKTKDLSIKLRLNCFEVFTVEVQSFSKPFQPRQKEGKKLNFWHKPQRRPHTPWSTSFQVKTAIPCVRSLNFEKRGE